MTRILLAFNIVFFSWSLTFVVTGEEAKQHSESKLILENTIRFLKTERNFDIKDAPFSEAMGYIDTYPCCSQPQRPCQSGKEDEPWSELLEKRSATTAAWPPLYSSERFKTRATHIQSCLPPTSRHTRRLSATPNVKEDKKRDSPGDVTGEHGVLRASDKPQSACAGIFQNALDRWRWCGRDVVDGGIPHGLPRFTHAVIRDPLGRRDRAMLELLYSAGLRRSELARLEIHDLNRERQTLHIRQGKGHKDRVVPVGSRALLWLE